MKRLIAALCSLAILTLPLPTAQAEGVSSQQGFVYLLTVNSTDDHNDFSCDATDCTLREAIELVNSAPTDDTINFSVTGVINLVAALPVISDGVTIQGPGADILTVRRDPAWGAFRIFEANTTEAVGLSGLTVREGLAIDGGGGGIKNSGTGTLNVINSKISDNSDSGGPSGGGGIYNSSTGTIMITDSTISGNMAFSSGGGIFNATGTVNVRNCIVSGNQVGLFGGGGIHNRTGSVTITDSIISDNSALANGGGILNFNGSIAIVNSTISGNLVSLRGGGGIFNSLTGLVNITNSTVSNNQAVIAGSSGGGIFNDAGTVNLTNSTISGNSSGGQTFSGNGGGIHSDRGTLNITNSTISSNRAGVSGGGISSFQGIANIKSTIVALNTSAFGPGPDVGGSFTSFGFNLIGKTDGSTGFTDPTDLTGTIASPLDPGLDPNGLQDNGGPTLTIALPPDSPAIDKGTANGLTTDQRGPGFPRTLDDPAVAPAVGGDNTDIGAFEVQPPPITAGVSSLINESCPPTNGAIDPGETATVNLTLMNSGTNPTTNLVATLQPNAHVLAPSGPATYGALAPGGQSGRDFTFTAAGNCGDTITLTLQLQDGSTNLGTVSYTFTLGCNTACAGAPRISTSTVLSCSGSNTVATVTICNSGTATANSVELTTANLGGVNGTPLPQTVGTLAPGACATVTVTFSGAPSGATTLQVRGTYTGGSFNSNRRVTAPLCTACTPGAPGCGWEDGDMVSYSQDNWGGDPTMSTAAGILAAHFNSIYGGGVEVGISGNAGFSIIFTRVAAVLNYLPSSGAPAPLNADIIDPTSTSSGLFGGFVLALQFNVDFADAGRISGTSGLVYGDLRLCGLSSTPAYNGLTIRQFLAEMNTALGAGPVAYTYDDVAVLTSDTSTAFESGTVSLFAQQHLFSSATCP